MAVSGRTKRGPDRDGITVFLSSTFHWPLRQVRSVVRPLHTARGSYAICQSEDCRRIAILVTCQPRDGLCLGPTRKAHVPADGLHRPDQTILRPVASGT